MRPQFGLVAMIAFGFSAQLVAQTPTDSLRRRHLSGGITLALPATWVPLSDSAEKKSAQIVDTALLNTHDTLLQASLKHGMPVFLLHETAPGRTVPSANFNAAPAPGATPASLDALTPQQIAAAFAPYCNSLRTMIEGLGARIVSCDSAQTDRAAGRTISIIRYVRTGPAGFVTVWLAQYFDKGVVYTLTLSAPSS